MLNPTIQKVYNISMQKVKYLASIKQILHLLVVLCVISFIVNSKTSFSLTVFMYGTRGSVCV